MSLADSTKTSSRLRKGGSRSGSVVDLHDLHTQKKGMKAPAGSPAWSSIFRFYWRDYTVLLLLVILLVFAEYQRPYRRWIYHHGTSELWRYSYPLYTSNTVPAWLVPIITLGCPALVIAVHGKRTACSRLEMHNAILGALGCVITCALITNVVKLQVGRPRPNFAARCWLGRPPSYDRDGFPECNPDAIDPDEGRKSFPSGHTSWSASGLGYLSLWAAGKLRLWAGQGHLWQLLLAGLPLQAAVCIGITRLQDYWHHWEDVVAGFALGLLCAYFFYRQHFHSVMSSRAGEALLTSLDGPAGSSLPESGSLSRMPLSYSQLELQQGVGLDAV